MKWNPIKATEQGVVDVLAVALAALPIVYRIGAILRELQPEIREWLQASTERAHSEATVTDEVGRLVSAVDALVAEIRSKDGRLAERLDAQDAALIKVLKAMADAGDHG